MLQPKMFVQNTLSHKNYKNMFHIKNNYEIVIHSKILLN